MDDARPAKPPAARRPAKKPRPVRAAFVVTVSMAATAAGAAGCFSTNNPPPPWECPASQPQAGDPCEPGSDCSYGDGCGSEVIATCGEDDTWEVEWTGSCNPPPPECPEAVPAHDEACLEPMECRYNDACGQETVASCDGVSFFVSPPLTPCNAPSCPAELPEDGSVCDVAEGPPEGCSYPVQTACGVATATAECVSLDDGATYLYEVTAPECTPPNPDCASYVSSALCAADTTCRWLVPGCGEGPANVFPTGCYAIDDCTIDSCAENEICTPIVYHPCFNSECAACGAEADVCVPNLGGG